MNKFIFVIFAVIIIFLGISNLGYARLSVSSPKGTLERANIVVEGIVESVIEETNSQNAILRITQVLKGNMTDKLITITVGSYLKGDNPPDKFPKLGTNVFILLYGEDNKKWLMAADLNTVGIIKNGYITELYKGSKIGINDNSWTQEDYVKAYDEYYQQNKKSEEIKQLVDTKNQHKYTWWQKIINWFKNVYRYLV